MQSESLAFADVLPEEAIQRAFDEEEAGFAQDEDAIYTPPLTLWAFLSQVLYKEEARSWQRRWLALLCSWSRWARSHRPMTQACIADRGRSFPRKCSTA